MISQCVELKLPDYNKPFYVTVAFNTFGYAAGLFQKEDKSLRPIAFRSKTRAIDTWKPQYLHKLEALVQAL